MAKVLCSTNIQCNTSFFKKGSNLTWLILGLIFHKILKIKGHISSTNFLKMISIFINCMIYYPIQICCWFHRYKQLPFTPSPTYLHSLTNKLGNRNLWKVPNRAALSLYSSRTSLPLLLINSFWTVILGKWIRFANFSIWIAYHII